MVFERNAVLVAIIAVLAIAALSGCGGDESEPSATATATLAAPATGGSPAPVTTAGPTVTPATTPATTPAAAEPTRGPELAEVTTLALDMDPHGDTPNDDRTVGPIESCVSVEPGDTFDIDVVLDAIPSTVGNGDLAGFQYFLGFDVAALTFVRQTHTLAGTNLIVRAPGSCGGPVGCLDRSEVPPEPPDSGSPPSPDVHDVLLADLGGPEGPEPADPAPHAGGVLGRYTIEANPEATPGVYGISLDSSATYETKLNDGAAHMIWDVPGNGLDDDGDGAIDEDLMLDATVGYGQVAIGVDCSETPR